MKRKYVHLELEDAVKLYDLLAGLRKTPQYQKDQTEGTFKSYYHREGLGLVDMHLAQEIKAVRRYQDREE